ncbi:MAG: hypothetical protein AAF399_12190 [Bacteroidota bacterium]
MPKTGGDWTFMGKYFLNEWVTLTAGLRCQQFATDVSEVVSLFEERNPGVVAFRGEHGDWQTYYLLLGAAYRIPIVKRFALYPRFGLGSLWTVSPGLEVQATNGASQNQFSRSSETGVGVGYELGVGLRTNLGKRFALLPIFTVNGGWVNLMAVETSFNSLTAARDVGGKHSILQLGTIPGGPNVMIGQKNEACIAPMPHSPYSPRPLTATYFPTMMPTTTTE